MFIELAFLMVLIGIGIGFYGANLSDYKEAQLRPILLVMAIIVFILAIYFFQRGYKLLPPPEQFLRK
jgi:hypothetical protein